MFDIVTSRDFLIKLEADYADFKPQPDSARHALNCIITAYHMYEWVWGDWLKSDCVVRGKLQIRDKESFKAWLYNACASFRSVEEITNGVKHFIRAPKVETERVSAYGQGPYGVGPYGTPYLLIDHGQGLPVEQRYQTAEQLIDNALTFWRGFFRDLRPVPTAPDEQV